MLMERSEHTYNDRKSGTEAKTERDEESEKKCTCAREGEREEVVREERARERGRILMSVEWGSRGVVQR